MTEEADESGGAPGWDSIDAALRPIYGDREPYHVGTILPYRLGGPDPIHGISAYKNTEPVPHWHFVTYGFSELWAKESGDSEVSGYGFELTFRHICNRNDEKPPNWTFNFLQNLGRYVFSTGNTFGPGHTIPLNGPIEQGSPTLIHVISFAHDTQLPPMPTPNGRVEFLQVVGLTLDELEAISSWDASAFLDLRGRHDPLLLTDLARGSWLEDGAFAAEVARRTKAEGSSCGWLSLVLECDTEGDPISVQIQTIAAEGLSRRLMGRLPFGRRLTLNGKEATVVFEPGKRTYLKIVEGAVTIVLRDDHAIAFAESLRPHAGVYPIPGLKEAVLEVVRTEITDRHGNVVDVVE